MAKLKFVILLRKRKLYCKYHSNRCAGELYTRRSRLRHILSILKGEVPNVNKRRIKFYSKS